MSFNILLLGQWLHDGDHALAPICRSVTIAEASELIKSRHARFAIADALIDDIEKASCK